MAKRDPVSLASPRTWLSPWVQMCEMAVVAPQVVTYRTIRIVTGGWPPNRRDRLEYARMVTEKVNALGQVSTAVLKARPGTGVAAMSGAIEPLHRKVLANHRRLSRARRIR